MKKRKIIGYVVVEADDQDNYEQILALREDDEQLPPGGILTWADNEDKRFIFPNRKAARAAITRTHHYAKAFGNDLLPEQINCKIHPVEIHDKPSAP